MRRIRQSLPMLAAALVAGLAVAPAAHADAFQTIFKDYAKTGKVNACKYSSKDLKDARRHVPKDIDQYAPDFPAALDAALAQRASGACSKKSSSGGDQQSPGGGAAIGGGTPTTQQPSIGITPPAATTPAQTTPQPTPGATPQPNPTVNPAPSAADDAIPAAALSAPNDKGADNTPAPLILLAVFGGLMLLGAVFYTAVRYWAFDPPWLQRARHSTSEAGWRASAAWAEFTDWLRFGR
jgi:hypothetical protein